MGKLWTFIAIALTMLLAVAGCGEGAKSSTTASSAVTTGSTATRPRNADEGTHTASTASALVSQGDAICKEFHDKRALLHAQTPKQLREFGAKVESYEKKALDAFVKLTPPSALASDWSVMVAGARKLATYTPKLVEDVANSVNTASAKETYGAAEQLRNKLFAIAKRDGFIYCSQAI